MNRFHQCRDGHLIQVSYLVDNIKPQAEVLCPVCLAHNVPCMAPITQLSEPVDKMVTMGIPIAVIGSAPITTGEAQMIHLINQDQYTVLPEDHKIVLNKTGIEYPWLEASLKAQEIIKAVNLQRGSLKRGSNYTKPKQRSKNKQQKQSRKQSRK